MRKSLIFPVFIIPGLFSCGDSNRSSNRDQGFFQGAQTTFDLAKSDFAPSQSESGSRLIFLTRRPGAEQEQETLAKLASYDRSRSRANRLQIWDTKELVDGDQAADLIQAVLSPDGTKILMAINGQEGVVLVVSSFDGSVKQNIELTGLRSIDSLSWAGDSSLFAVGGLRENNGTQQDNGIWLGLIQESDGSIEVSVETGPEGKQPTLVSSDDDHFLNFWRFDGDHRLIHQVELSHDGESIAIDSTSEATVSRPRTVSQHELFYADSQRIYLTETNTELRVRQRWGNRVPAEEGPDNIGRVTVTQPLVSIGMDNLELDGALDFDVFRGYEPTSLQSVASTRSGDLVLMVGPQVIACENLTLHGNMMLLVHTQNQTVVPLIPTTDSDRLTNGLVSDPCDHLDESRPAVFQPLDLRVRSARIAEIEPGVFQISYESRVLDDLEIFFARFQLPNIDDVNLNRSNLSIENLVIENISQNNRNQ